MFMKFTAHEVWDKFTRGFWQIHTRILQTSYAMCANGHILLTMLLSVLPRTAQQLPLLRARRADLDVYAAQRTRGLDAAQGIIADVL